MTVVQILGAKGSGGMEKEYRVRARIFFFMSKIADFKSSIQNHRKYALFVVLRFDFLLYNLSGSNYMC